jgi:hypothetical protein
LRKQLKNGFVILGIPSPKAKAEADDDDLIASGVKFDGLTVEEAALKSTTREIGEDVDYAVFDSLGHVQTQLGGIPSVLDSSSSEPGIGEGMRSVATGGKDYLLLITPIVDRSQRRVGKIVVALDVTLQREALWSQHKFNFFVSGVSLILLLTFAGLVFLSYERRRLRIKVSVEDALKRGEGMTIEFKETLEYSGGLPEQDRAVLMSSLKTIAGFLNSSGGALFIGVSDWPIKPVGIEKDLRSCKNKNTDGLEQKLRARLHDLFNPPSSRMVDVEFESVQGETVCAVYVPPIKKSEVVYLEERVYIREGVLTRKLEGAELVNWIRDRFRGR